MSLEHTAHHFIEYIKSKLKFDFIIGITTLVLVISNFVSTCSIHNIEENKYYREKQLESYINLVTVCGQIAEGYRHNRNLDSLINKYQILYLGETQLFVGTNKSVRNNVIEFKFILDSIVSTKRPQINFNNGLYQKLKITSIKLGDACREEIDKSYH
jgi:hypothetical protein